MKHSSDLLPSLNALRAFESASRHLSFKDAAAELNVSASAVGHLVADLEAFFDVQLFIRRHRRIELTPDGRALMPGLQTAFDHMRDAVRVFQESRLERPLILSVEPSFGLHCLIPRMESFRALHPDITIRVEANYQLQDPRVDDVDICIRYGNGDYPGLQVDTIAEDEEIIAVCSPELLTGEHPLHTPDDIRWHTLIDRPDGAHYRDRANWRRWFKAAGLKEVLCKGRLEVSYESYAIMSAIQGNGIALANAMMAATDLKVGRLVQPFDVSYRVDLGYYMLTSTVQSQDVRIQAFRDWVMNEEPHEGL